MPVVCCFAAGYNNAFSTEKLRTTVTFVLTVPQRTWQNVNLSWSVLARLYRNKQKNSFWRFLWCHLVRTWLIHLHLVWPGSIMSSFRDKQLLCSRSMMVKEQQRRWFEIHMCTVQYNDRDTREIHSRRMHETPLVFEIAGGLVVVVVRFITTWFVCTKRDASPSNFDPAKIVFRLRWNRTPLALVSGENFA